MPTATARRTASHAPCISHELRVRAQVRGGRSAQAGSDGVVGARTIFAQKMKRFPLPPTEARTQRAREGHKRMLENARSSRAGSHREWWRVTRGAYEADLRTAKAPWPWQYEDGGGGDAAAETGRAVGDPSRPMSDADASKWWVTFSADSEAVASSLMEPIPPDDPTLFFETVRRECIAATRTRCCAHLYFARNVRPKRK